MYTFKINKKYSKNLYKDRSYEILNCFVRIRFDDIVLVFFMFYLISIFYVLFSIRIFIWYLYNNMYRFFILFMIFYC